MPKRVRSRNRSRKRLLYFFVAAAVVAVIGTTLFFFAMRSDTLQTSSVGKPIILYVNQGNGVVNQSNFNRLISFSSSRGFNTIFFQIYRSGVLLFTPNELTSFVTAAHSSKLKIFFALYFTNSSQSIPASIYSLGEDGINLDMSTLDAASQSNLLSMLSLNFQGTTAVTSLDFATSLKPNWLIFETYGQNNQYIHSGIIASVGVFTTSSKAEYQQEFQYALANSDGVMVFDYATLSSRGY